MKRKGVGAVIGLIGLLSSAGWAQCLVPQVVNGSFPEYWGHWWDDGAPDSIKKCIWDGEVYQDAAGSCRIEIYKRGRGSVGWWDWNYIEQPPIEGASLPCVGDTLVWSVWVKAKREWRPVGTTGGGRQVFRLIVIDHCEPMDGSNPHYKEFIKYCAPNTEWQNFSVNFCRAYEDNLYLFCKIEFADTGTLWIDNATITRKGAGTAVNPAPGLQPGTSRDVLRVRADGAAGAAWRCDLQGRRWLFWPGRASTAALSIELDGGAKKAPKVIAGP